MVTKSATAQWVGEKIYHAAIAWIVVLGMVSLSQGGGLESLKAFRSHEIERSSSCWCAAQCGLVYLSSTNCWATC